MGNFRQSLYHASQTEFVHDGFVLQEKVLKVLDGLEIDLDVLCTILEQEDIDARKYVLETIKPTRTLYNYLKGKIEYTKYIKYKIGFWRGNSINIDYQSVSNSLYPKYIKAVNALRAYSNVRKGGKDE